MLIVDIITFISRISTTSESLKQRKIFIFHHFTFHEHLKFHAQSIPVFLRKNIAMCDFPGGLDTTPSGSAQAALLVAEYARLQIDFVHI